MEYGITVMLEDADTVRPRLSLTVALIVLLPDVFNGPVSNVFDVYVEPFADVEYVEIVEPYFPSALTVTLSVDCP
jgi:hypothetical protein